MMAQQKQQVTIQAQQQQQQQNILKLTHHKKHQIHQHHQAMLAAKHSQAIATPPTTPSPPIAAQQSPVSAQAPMVPAAQQQKQVIITEHNANDMSVDDHFAKALGDTWKQIQNEGKWFIRTLTLGPRAPLSLRFLPFLSHSVAIWRWLFFLSLSMDLNCNVYEWLPDNRKATIVFF